MTTPETLERSDLDVMEALIAASPSKPFAYHGDDAASTRLLRARIDLDLARGFGVRLDDRAFAVGRPLAWDTERLGVACGRIDHILWSDPRDLDHLVNEACAAFRGHGVRHVSVRVDARAPQLVQALERAGFLTVDGLITLSREATGGPGTLGRIAQAEDFGAIVAIARSSFAQDRFHSDPAISSAAADDVYAAWAENSCRGTAADAVVVADVDGRIGAFVTCAIDEQASRVLGMTIGSTPLVATASSARRRGAARSALAHALAWFSERGVRIVEVGTQVSNVAAARLYLSCGFRPVAAHVSLRWLEGEVSA